jgi:hypothetical protein
MTTELVVGVLLGTITGVCGVALIVAAPLVRLAGAGTLADDDG